MHHIETVSNQDSHSAHVMLIKELENSPLSGEQVIQVSSSDPPKVDGIKLGGLHENDSRVSRKSINMNEIIICEQYTCRCHLSQDSIYFWVCFER